jgi:hypothetical protein
MQTSDDKMSATHQYSDGQRMMIEDYRVYYGDGGEEIDSPSHLNTAPAASHPTSTCTRVIALCSNIIRLLRWPRCRLAHGRRRRSRGAHAETRDSGVTRFGRA